MVCDLVRFKEGFLPTSSRILHLIHRFFTKGGQGQIHVVHRDDDELQPHDSHLLTKLLRKWMIREKESVEIRCTKNNDESGFCWFPALKCSSCVPFSVFKRRLLSLEQAYRAEIGAIKSV
jgi:hypothetical protein